MLQLVEINRVSVTFPWHVRCRGKRNAQQAQHSMPRRSRLNLTDVPQHIIQRGNNRQATFFAEEDYRCFLDYLLDASRKYGCVAYAYVLMTNHVHLLASA